MSRYIDADAIITFVSAGHLRNPMEKTWSDNDVVDMIESRPTVDAVSVTVCASCKYDGKCMFQSFVIENSQDDVPYDRNTFYCADGERRTDEQQSKG